MQVAQAYTFVCRGKTQAASLMDKLKQLGFHGADTEIHSPIASSFGLATVVAEFLVLLFVRAETDAQLHAAYLKLAQAMNEWPSDSFLRWSVIDIDLSEVKEEE